MAYSTLTIPDADDVERQIKVDVIASILHHLTKVGFGGENVWTEVSAANPLPVAPSAGETHIGAVGGHTVTVSATVTRPADTTQYAAGDSVNAATGAVITFTNAARVAAGSGVITSAVLVDNVNAGTKGEFELWLFDTTLTPANDNAAFAPSDAEALTCIGVIPFTTAYAASVNAVYPGTGLPVAFACPSGRNLFGALVARSTYTPTSGEVFTIRLTILQD